MSHFIKMFLIFLGGIILWGCNPKIGELPLEKLPRIREKFLLETLDSINKQRPNFLYTKVDTKYSDTTRSISFKTSLKMRADSALHTMITYAMIPVVHSLVTIDSVIIVNKRDKCIERQNLEFLKESFGVDFSFKNVEEIILGLPLDYDPSQKYFQIHDPYNYIISSHRKRKIKRVEKQGDENDVIVKYYLNNEANHLKAMYIESPMDSTKIMISYLSRQEVKGYRIPERMNVEITTPRNHILMELKYDKAEIDEPREMILVIPEKYGICE